jgi:glycogen operon protein
MVFNAHHETIDVTLPDEQWGKEWAPVIDTAVGVVRDATSVTAGAQIRVESRSFVLLMRNP